MKALATVHLAMVFVEYRSNVVKLAIRIPSVDECLCCRWEFGSVSCESHKVPCHEQLTFGPPKTKADHVLLVLDCADENMCKKNGICGEQCTE